MVVPSCTCGIQRSKSEGKDVVSENTAFEVPVRHVSEDAQ